MKIRLISRFLKQNTSLVIGSIMLLMIMGVAIFAPYLTPHDPIRVNTREALEPISRNHPLGTDPWGRDLLSRIIFGSRYSLTIGVVSMGISMICGGIFGMLGGYYLESKFGKLVVWIIDIMMAFPTIILGVIIVMMVGTGVFNTIITLAVAYFPRYARLARGAALGTKEELYIYAAKSLGMSDFRLLFSHLIPNIISPLIVMAVIWTSSAISLEVALSFLGLGVPPPTPSWGTVLQDSLQYYSIQPLAVIAPCIAVAWAVQALNLMGDRFRDVLDPRTR